MRSRDEASVLEELRRLADAGYKEVVLTAISLPSYGTDSGTSLVELIEKAAEVPGIDVYKRQVTLLCDGCSIKNGEGIALPTQETYASFLMTSWPL